MTTDNLPPLPEPALFAHELIENGGGIWLGCDDRRVCEQSHVEGETGEEIRELFTADQFREYGRACAQAALSTAPVQGLTDEQIDALSRDLDIECERAMRQRDEFKRTGVSTAHHDGASHDTCFRFIVTKHFSAALAAAPHTATPVVQPVVPAGWRLVPVEPTPEMEQAAADYLDACVKAHGLWLAMCAAAPASDADSMPAQPTKEPT